MILTNDNYYSEKANVEFFSVSQFKSFLDCEASTMAELYGMYRKPTSDAMLIGAFVDSYFSDEYEKFCDTHPLIYNARGELRKAFRDAHNMIIKAENDEFFMSYLNGDWQQILTGEIFGHPFKGKLDVLHSDKIVDLKCMKDLRPIYKNGEKQTFIKAYGYDYQAYVYQELVRQKTGKKLPFYLAVITKEAVPDIEVIEVPQWLIDSAGQVMSHYLPRFAEVKAGNIEPAKCGHCEYCKKTKVLTGTLPYEELL